MTLSQAKTLIKDDTASPIAWLKATTLLTGREDISNSYFDDLLWCLKRGEPSASSAAITLYYRTERPKPEDITEYDHDVNSWKNYLLDNRFLKV